MVRCYDCGQPIPDEQIVRREVRTGTSEGYAHVPRDRREHYRKVNLCPKCDAERNKRPKTPVDWLVERVRRFVDLVRWLTEDKGRPLKAFALIAQPLRRCPAEWIDKVQTLKVCTLIATAFVMLVICSGISQVGQEKKEKDAQKSEAAAVKPIDQRKQDAGAAEKLPDAAKKQIQPPPPKTLARESSDVVKIKGFLCISPDFTAYATTSARIVELKSGRNLVSLKWDNHWGFPSAAAFNNDLVVASVWGSGFGGSDGSVKIFSRKTGELQQNLHIHGHVIKRLALTANGRFLVFSEWRPHKGEYVVIRDIQGKRAVAEVLYGGSGYCSLAAAGKYAAAYDSNNDLITVLEVETGKVVKQFKSRTFRKRKEGLGEKRMPLAISPAGDLVACGEEDDVVLYDISSENVVHNLLEGHLDSVRAVVFSPNGEIVASAAKDKTIRFWNVKQGKEVHIITDLPASAVKSLFSDAVPDLIFSADGDRIALVTGYAVSREVEIRNVELK